MNNYDEVIAANSYDADAFDEELITKYLPNVASSSVW